MYDFVFLLPGTVPGTGLIEIFTVQIYRWYLVPWYWYYDRSEEEPITAMARHSLSDLLYQYRVNYKGYH